MVGIGLFMVENDSLKLKKMTTINPQMLEFQV